MNLCLRTILLVSLIASSSRAEDESAEVSRTAKTGWGDETRPPRTVISTAIGAGVTFPADITLPDTVSARFRLASGLALEPSVTLAVTGAKEKADYDGGDSEDTANGIVLMAGALARLPLASRGPVDFLGLGGVALSYASVVDDPDGDDNEVTTRTLGFEVLWGLGLEWFVRPHWSISFDALNPVIAIASEGVETDSVDTSTTSYLIGAIFDPTVRLMAHLYF